MRCRLLDQLPCPFHVSGLRIRLANTKPQSELTIELGMRQIKATALVEAFHEFLVVVVSGAQTEADEIQRHWGGQFKARIVANPVGELLRDPHVLADMLLQSFDSVMPDYKP